MVVVCPQCKANQSVAQAQVGAGGTVACNKCGHRFAAAGGAPKVEQDLAKILGPSLSGELGGKTAPPGKAAPPRAAPTPRKAEAPVALPLDLPPILAVAPIQITPHKVAAAERHEAVQAPGLEPPQPRDRSITGVHLRVSAWRLPPFPAAAMRNAGAALAQYVRAVPTPPKLAAAGGLLALALGLIALMLWGGDTVFLSEARPLFTGPAGSAFEIIDHLDRGDRVERLHADGDWALVRAPSGRIGYVDKAALVGSAPPVAPGWPFAGCRRRPLETDGALCQARAKDQFHACRDFCDEPRCVEKCQGRFNECDISCLSPARPVHVSTPSPEMESEPALTAPEPAAKEERKPGLKRARRKVR